MGKSKGEKMGIKDSYTLRCRDTALSHPSTVLFVGYREANIIENQRIIITVAKIEVSLLLSNAEYE